MKMVSLNWSYTIPLTTTEKNKTTFKPSESANAFNIYFANVAIDLQSSIRFSMKKYFDYLNTN